jgi:hypothetical protein
LRTLVVENGISMRSVGATAQRNVTATSLAPTTIGSVATKCVRPEPRNV